MTTAFFLWLAITVALTGCAYCLGSVPPGYLAGKWLKGIDIREHGSGSTGATNVLRTIGKLPALVVFVVDIGKAVMAIVLARFLYVTIAAQVPALATVQIPISSLPPFSEEQWLPWLAVLTGMAALLGHSKSLWLNFTGGKSVASGLGVLLTLDWRVGLLTLAVFGVMLALTRIVSLSSIVAAIACCILMPALNSTVAYSLLTFIGGIYVISRHSSNIQRLLTGTEPRLGEKTAQPPKAQEGIGV